MKTRITLGALLAVALVLYASASWIGAGWLLMPPRKTLRTWQAALISNPRPSGMQIKRAITRNGTPYLCCTPDASAGPGERGRILRRQLAESGSSPRPFGRQCGTLVMFHGWGMRKEDLLPTAERFCAAGLRCLIPDLPGHGENPQPVAGFGASETDRLFAGEVLDDAAARFHFSGRPAGLWGLSMGGAYALQAGAAQPERWNALVVVSSFDSLGPVVCRQLDQHATQGLAAFLNPGLSAAIRMRGGFWPGGTQPLENARQLTCPVLIVYGSSDDLIPISDGRRLFGAVPDSRKRWLAVDGALHGNVLGTPQHVFVEMSGWFLAWLSTDGAKSPTFARSPP